MSKFRVGDKVRVKDELKSKRSKHVSAEMVAMYTGKRATITYVGRSAISGKRYYMLDIDNGRWSWWNHTLERVYDTVELTNLGGQYPQYDTWFELPSTPKRLRKFSGKFRLYKDAPLNKPLRIIGEAPHACPDRTVVLLQDPDTECVYLYAKENLDLTLIKE